MLARRYLSNLPIRGEVTGLELDKTKVDQINRRRSCIKHIVSKTIGEVLKAGD
jgi:hypothetical protein